MSIIAAVRWPSTPFHQILGGTVCVGAALAALALLSHTFRHHAWRADAPPSPPREPPPGGYPDTGAASAATAVTARDAPDLGTVTVTVDRDQADAVIAIGRTISISGTVATHLGIAGMELTAQDPICVQWAIRSALEESIDATASTERMRKVLEFFDAIGDDISPALANARQLWDAALPKANFGSTRSDV